MRKRMHLKSKNHKTFLEKLIMSFLFSFLLALFIFFLVHIKMAPSLAKHASGESEQCAKSILNNTVRNTMKNTLQNQQLYQTSKNSQDEIQAIDFNTTVVNNLLQQITKDVTEALLKLENGDLSEIEVSQSFKGASFKQYRSGVVCEIPMGLLTNHFFIANLGPVIPIRFSFVGTMDANLKSKITPYGINNALIEIYILVELTEKITMPLSSEKVKINLSVPIVSQLITGKIPTYYQGSMKENSNIFSLPLTEN